MRRRQWTVALLAVFLTLWAVSPSAAPRRFVDNGDGTITDSKTGLMWEKKTDCTSYNFNDPHCVNNVYAWGNGSISEDLDPSGTLFTKGLDYMNRADGSSADGQTIDRKHYTDWRLPTITELRSIVNCNLPNCLDPIFGPVSPPDNVEGNKFHFSSTSVSGNREKVWAVDFLTGLSVGICKCDLSVNYFRAVRSGR